MSTAVFRHVDREYGVNAEIIRGGLDKGMLMVYGIAMVRRFTRLFLGVLR